MKELSANDDRIQRALEGLLPADEQAALQHAVIDDEKVRAAYVDQAWLHAALRAERESLAALLDEEKAGARLSDDSSKAAIVHEDWDSYGKIFGEPAPRFSSQWIWAAAAGVMLLASVALLGKSTLLDRPVATLVAAENCQWAGSDLPTAVNSKLGTGKLALVEGIATLRFKNGAIVTMEAPTTLEILTAMHCRLLEGTLTAEVPEPAHGFTIDTPDIKVVDLGTKFGVTTAATGNSQVRVFEGEVEIGGLSGGKMKRLTEGKGLHVGSGATPAGQEATRGQQVQEAGGWTAIPTSFGRGKDGYARRGDNGAPLGTQPLIIVKHSDIEAGRKNERRAVLTFDVSQVAAAAVAEVQLVLDPEPSGFGFSALIPDESRFAIYGLIDETLDGWDEKDVRWDSLPGCNDAGADLNLARKLGEFWLARGASGGPLTVRSEALAEFLRADTNGLVTLLLVRESGETDCNGLAHAFASKEHPSARPPTLRLK